MRIRLSGFTIGELIKGVFCAFVVSTRFCLSHSLAMVCAMFTSCLSAVLLRLACVYAPNCLMLRAALACAACRAFTCLFFLLAIIHAPCLRMENPAHLVVMAGFGKQQPLRISIGQSMTGSVLSETVTGSMLKNLKPRRLLRITTLMSSGSVQVSGVPKMPNSVFNPLAKVGEVAA